MPNLAEKLAAYAAALQFKDLPASTVHQAKRRLIDSLACALGGYLTPPSKIARKLALAEKTAVGKGPEVFGTAATTSPSLAAFHFGVLVRCLDFNDTYLSKEPAHPSDNLAACLASAGGNSGAAILTAQVLAYEVQCRLADAASIRARGWDHVTYGAFSSALAAGRLMGLNQVQLLQALNLAGVSNVAMRQTRAGELSMWKGCAFANAARNGVFAAQLAGAGMTGPSPIFEGEMGFFKQVSGSFKLPVLGRQSGGYMLDKTSIKFYPVEYHAQSAVQAALELRQGLRIADIQAIEIESFDAAVDIIAGGRERWYPKSRETADHSLPYCVAVALKDGQVDLASFDDRHLADPGLSRLVQKIKVTRSAVLNRQYPRAVPNRVIVKLKGGQSLSRLVTYPLGHSGNPVSDRQVEEKFRSFAVLYFNEQRIVQMLDKLWNFEKQPGWQPVAQLFRMN